MRFEDTMLGLDAVIAIAVSGMLVGAPAPAAAAPSEPVPVQRPSSLRSTPPEPARLRPPTPAPPPVSEPETTRKTTSVRTGRIEGRVTAAELEGVVVAGANVELLCPCLRQPLVTMTDDQGRFDFEGLPPGEYTLLVDRGGVVSREHMFLPAEGNRRTEVSVAPPFPTEMLEDRHQDLSRAKTMIAVGSVSAIASALMLISAGVEAAKPECLFGPEGCEDPPRPRLAAGLGVTGGLLAVGGATLIYLGVRRMRRVEARFQIDARTAGVVLSGRF